MAKIYSAGVFAPPAPEPSAQDPPWIGLIQNIPWPKTPQKDFMVGCGEWWWFTIGLVFCFGRNLVFRTHDLNQAEQYKIIV